MEDVKDILTFKGGVFLGVVMWILLFMMTMLIVMAIMLPFHIAADKKEMAEHHCVRTNESNTYLRSSTILVGKVIVPTTQSVTEYKYTCDDHERWR